MTDETSDLEVVSKVLRGDTEAFSLLVERYESYVFRVVQRHVPYERVEEVSQEAFVQAYRSLATFKGESSFKTWLAKVAVRRCYDFWRAQRRSREVNISTLGADHEQWLDTVLAADSSAVVAKEEGQKRAREILSVVLSELSAEERIIITLLHIEEYSVREIASTLNLSVPNVKIKAFRARKKLQRAISLLLLKEDDEL